MAVEKVTALKIMMKNSRFQIAFRDLGQDWTLEDQIMDVFEEFTCQMYLPRTQIIKKVDEMRFQLFRAKTGDIQS